MHSSSVEPAQHTEQPDLLYDLYPENQLEDASMGKRFANYLIDIVAFYIFCLFLGLVLGVLQVAGVVNLTGRIPQEGFGSIFFSLFLYVVFMTLCEGLSGGRSLGKLITGTRAVTEDGGRITFVHALRRSLCRVIPFEQFSIFFGWRPWHDQWTNSMVVKKQQQ